MVDQQLQTKPLVVGVVGLGAMGGPIAEHLLEAQIPVLVAELDPEKSSHYEAKGARASATLDELGRGCDVVLVVVQTDEDVLQVCLGPGGLLSGCRSGTVVLLCSSVRPETCQAVLEAAPEGVSVLDAALTGGVRAAESGDINLLVGGAAAALEAVRPVLEPWTRGVHHMGGLGSGQVAKTVNNLIHWGQVTAITEALEFGRRLGLSVPQMRIALTGGVTDSATLHGLEHARFTWFEKDMDNAEAMAAQVPMDLPVARTARVAMRGVTVPWVRSLLELDEPAEG